MIIAQRFIELKEGDGYSVSEIAARLVLPECREYYLLEKAVAIGKKYNS